MDSIPEEPDRIAPQADVGARWAAALEHLSRRMQARGVHPSRVVVLLPYAQLVPTVVELWRSREREGFMPRFQTSRQWADELGLEAWSEPTGLDFTGQTALDLLTARHWLTRAGLGADAAWLAPRLVEATAELVPVAAAQAPARRAEWGRCCIHGCVAGWDVPWLRHERALATLALTWASQSAYASDALWDDAATAAYELIFWMDHFIPDPLLHALAAHWGARAEPFTVEEEAIPPGRLRVHAKVGDLEEEAERAAACVLAHVRSERRPVALAATDRLLTRRIRAWLGLRGVRARDETGWRLSTTRAAARIVAVLRACAWDASTDQVLDLLKNLPGDAHGVDALERWSRQRACARWRDVLRLVSLEDAGSEAFGESGLDTIAREWLASVERWRSRLGPPRPFHQWQDALAEVLRELGLWAPLAADPAGSEVLAVLGLEACARAAWRRLESTQHRTTAAEFLSWVESALESASFVPPATDEVDVIIVPLGQMRLRRFGAAVLPGCDARSLPLVPETLGFWSDAQRRTLGLPDRSAWAWAQRRAWAGALTAPQIDILWRMQDEQGEPLMPSPLLQATLDTQPWEEAADPRSARALALAPQWPPQALGADLPVERLSASAYADLRTCPYRFFALRQLGLRSLDELEEALDASDYGRWLHEILRRFHEACPRPSGRAREDLRASLDAAAAAVDGGRWLEAPDYLPYRLVWPRLREAYLEWLLEVDARLLAQVEGVELWRERRLGPWLLVGQIDRVDRLQDGRTRLVDYKTESRQRTQKRVREPDEDTQLAFYAALYPELTVEAAYLNVHDREGCTIYALPEVDARREALLRSIEFDLRRVAEGHPLRALGEGEACDWCAARGLCRRDSWPEGGRAEEGAP
ncbi:PD-(D/E)XK nuclease family protein [Tibeticola sp.]|uniref:PD-(D/E)XK nuclease family protein n=1 Tax=Tibeticola sp. TaxID=2005368 RepID=UPI00258661F5|nr:PD-(D/E)XK nuclease family protein [Tibeticola sp.]MCI4440071.1 PD-(D/E)XK nuclease family protein [Tibeticola sp.]